MRVAITGAAGMLGHDLARVSAAAGDELTTLSRAELDITDAYAVTAAIAAAAPEVVFNCAAYTNVDGAESNSEAAFACNVEGARNVARAAAAAGAWTIHVSSDYVFDGAKREPYVESDPTAPMSTYGASKLAGEVAVADAASGAHTVVRSSWLFGTGGPCFPATILRAGAERDQLTVVDDQVGCPTFTGHLAQALRSLACARVPGIVHVAGAGECSWFDFASEIVRAGALVCSVQPGRTADLGRPAPRPAYSVLRTERSAEVPSLPHWHEGLSEYMSTGIRA